MTQATVSVREAQTTVRLGDVLAQDTRYVAAPETRPYPKLSVKLYGKGVVPDGIVDGVSLKMRRHQIAHEGQVILSEIWGKKGAIGLVPKEGEGALCTSHFFLFEVDKLRVDPEFLNIVFKANYLEPQLSAQAKGTTGYAAVRPRDLLSATIPLPPLPEQRRVIEKVAAIRAKITEARNLNQQNTDDMIRLGKRLGERIIFGIPRSYWRELGSLVEIRGGGTPAKGNPAYWQGDLPWVTPKDMKIRVIRDSINHISEVATIESPAKPLSPGAVLIVVRGMILAHTVPAAVLGARAAINQDMKALIPGPDLRPGFLCSLLWALNGDLLRIVEKSTHDTRKLETSKLLAFKIPVPPFPEQERFEQVFDCIAEKTRQSIAGINDTARDIEHLLSGVFARALAGGL